MIHPVLIIIILVDYLIPIQWSDGQEVAWFLPPVGWLLNLCPEIITSVRRETLTGAFNLPLAVCLLIGAIELFPKARGLSHLQLIIWSRVLSNIFPIYEWKAAHHIRKGELIHLLCSQISWNGEKLPVVNGSRKSIFWKRSHAYSSLVPQPL